MKVGYKVILARPHQGFNRLSIPEDQFGREFVIRTIHPNSISIMCPLSFNGWSVHHDMLDPVDASPLYKLVRAYIDQELAR